MLKIFILLGFITVQLIAGNKEQRYEFFEKDGYKKITKETVEFAKENLNVKVNYPGYEAYDFLFQKEPFDILMKEPYMLVQINESQRIPMSGLKKMSGSIYRFDKETNILWRMLKDKLNVIIPTNYGSVNVYCYSTKESFEKDKIEFEKFINSIAISKEAKYNSTFIRESEFLYDLFYNDKTKIYYSSIAMIAGIVTVFITRKKIV